MLYNLLYPLADQMPVFNLFRYITFRTGGAIITSVSYTHLTLPTNREV